MKTTAAVCYGLNQPFVVEELDLDPPGPGEVLVEMAAGGVCHSDWHVVDGTLAREFPVILGHEGSARVLETGAGVRLVQPGDGVVLSFIPDCGHCRWCTAGRPTLCDNRTPFAAGTMADGGIRFHRNGRPIFHFNGVSSFSRYSVVPERGCIPIDPRVPLDQAALIGCALSTGVGAVLHTAGVRAGQSMAVIGCGGVGLCSIQGGRLVNAHPVIAVDRDPRKLELARGLGATHTVDASREDVVEAVLELTGGEGVEFAFEAIGLPETARQAFLCLAKRGAAVMIGIAPRTADVPIPPQQLVFGERMLRGSFYGSCRPRTDFVEFAELCRTGRLRLDAMVTRQWRLEEINEAFRAMRDGEVARGIINRYD